MVTTSVPQPTLGPTGVIVPLESDIYAGVFADINAAFGGHANPALNTPQGQLATSETAMIGAQNDQLLWYVNGVDPAFSSGRMQDAIARIYFLTRIPATSTVAQCDCGGLAGTIIPIGALAKDTVGNLYSATAAGTIGVSGTVSIPFACMVTGPIACPATTLNAIYQAVTGWNSISNPADGVTGRNVESRAAFEARRAASVAGNSVGVLSAIRANVLAVSGVLNAYVTENATGSPVTTGGVTIAANSLYVSATGGASADIALAIFRKKPPGCAYTGSASVTVTDSNSGYQTPYPTYTVKYDIQTALPIIFAVSIPNTTAVPSNAAALIQAAIVSAFSGGDGGPVAQSGATIYATRYYPPIAALGSWAQVITLTLGSQLAPGATFTGVIAGTALTSSATTGTIAIGQTVIGAGIPDGTVIISGSGTSWVINNTLTIASETMYGVTATLSSILPHINQAPVTSAANIAVTLV